MARRRHGTRKGGRKKHRFTFRGGQAGGGADELMKQLTVVQGKQDALDKAIAKLEEVCKNCTEEENPSGPGDKPGPGLGPDAQGDLDDEEKEKAEKEQREKEEAEAKKKQEEEEAEAAKGAAAGSVQAQPATQGGPPPAKRLRESETAGEGGPKKTETAKAGPETPEVEDKPTGGGGGGFLEAFFSGGGRRRRRRGKTCGRAPVRRRTRRR